MQITVRTMMGQEIPVKVQADATVEDLKMKIYRQTDMYPDQQVLIFNGEELDDDEPLVSYRIQEGSTVHLLPRVSSGLVAC
jgi:Ubiquitin family